MIELFLAVFLTVLFLSAFGAVALAYELLKRLWTRHDNQQLPPWLH